MLAYIVSMVVSERAFTSSVTGPLSLLVLVVAVRAVMSWLRTTLPAHAAIAVKQRLRERVISSAGRIRQRPTGEIVAVAVHGLDALDSYFTRYLPELVRAATVPVAVLIALFSKDVLTALIVLCTLPLTPVFGALIGKYTANRTRRQWRVLEILSHHFYDVVSGLPTLRLFGRDKAQAETVARVTERHRHATMATLRVAMLSALVLELVATLSVAVVAVSVGLRLLHGGLSLQTALFLLIVTPEAYLPFRRAAAEYHAAAEGAAAAERAFALLDETETTTRHDMPPTPRSPSGVTAPPDPVTTPLTLSDIVVRFADRTAPALDHLDLTIRPGRVTAIVGPSGCGKSTLLRVLLGLHTPDTGAVFVGDTELATIALPAWHRQIAWLPQHPHVVAGSVADNIRLGRPHSSDQDVQAAAAQASILTDLTTVPHGLTSAAAHAGNDLSAGQRQRLALARVFLRSDASLVLLDEPTTHLDDDNAADVESSIRGFANGRTTVIVTHRPALLEVADDVVDLARASVP